MAFTYERIILLVLAAILFFLPASSCNSLWPSPLRLLVQALSSTDAIKRAQLFTAAVTYNDRFWACHCYLLRHQCLTIRIVVNGYAKARSHINFQIKTLEKYKTSQSRSRSVFFPFQKKKIREQNWLIFKKSINFLIRTILSYIMIHRRSQGGRGRVSPLHLKYYQ